MSEIKQCVRDMLEIAEDVMTGDLREDIGSTNRHGDVTIGMDVAVERAVIEYLDQSPLSVKLFSEEAGEVDLDGQDAEYLVVIDPLDGSTNYKLTKGLQPYGILTAIVRASKNPTFGDIVAAGASVHMNDSSDPGSRIRSWVYDGTQTTDRAGNPVDLRQQQWDINGSTPVMLNLYKQEYWDTFRPIPGDLFPRNTGSAIGNMAHVLCGGAALTGDVWLKGEEVGAVYGLIKGANGLVTDIHGTPIDHLPFDPNEAYPIFAGNPQVLEHAAALMRHALPRLG